ncbi:unnamed protein product [Vicia faba]|uniref:SWIM-type domain-containing protein n=1 Tax=Vicia faba TaxID=3906 RepID=A0AAV1B0A9_VICFA|nr:unnamed protein product [Vicia faba]
MVEQFQVTHSYNKQEFIVDITNRSCSCNFWELVGIPCRHDVADLSYRKQNPDEFVDECYTREIFSLCYVFSISPINGQDMWPEVEMKQVLPPSYKKRSSKGLGSSMPNDGPSIMDIDFALPTDGHTETNIFVATAMSQTGAVVANSILRQSKKQKGKKPVTKRRQSERIKLIWFKKLITGPRSTEQPITIPEVGEKSCSKDSKLGVKTRFMKTWKAKK